MFKKVCIIGCGLIGSSIARGIKKNKLSTKVVSSNRSNSTNKKVIRLKIVDEASSNTKKIVKGSDLIIIASPLSSYKNIILKIKSSLKNGAILTDVGSVKKKVISLIEKNVPKCKNAISYVLKLLSLNNSDKTTRCPLEEIGKNSVTPCMIPNKISIIIN